MIIAEISNELVGREIVRKPNTWPFPLIRKQLQFTFPRIRAFLMDEHDNCFFWLPVVDGKEVRKEERGYEAQRSEKLKLGSWKFYIVQRHEKLFVR